MTYLILILVSLVFAGVPFGLIIYAITDGP